MALSRAFATAFVALAVLLQAGTAQAASGVRFGIMDDAWLMHGDGTLDSRVGKLDRIGIDIVRLTLRWDAIASHKPRTATNPRDPAYRWGAAGTALDALTRHGIDAMVTLVGTPRWANGGRGPNWAPGKGIWFADFATAAARRFPYVRHWTIWNEPNQRLWLRPTSPRVYVTTLLNPAYAAIKSELPRALVGGGVTAPRGNSGGVSPLSWIRGMADAGATLDAYAHNPYPLVPKAETPWTGGCAHCETVTMATLEKLITAVRSRLGSKRIWLTEYAYQTNPPDPWLGVSWALQARYVAEAGLRAWSAPYVDMLIHFLYRDDVTRSVGSQAAWESGLMTAAGQSKPSLRAFMLPLAQVSRDGRQTTVWGQVRPRSGHQAFRLQVLRGGAWRWLGPTRTTDSTGTLRLTLDAGPGTSLRIWSPSDGAGVVLVVR